MGRLFLCALVACGFGCSGGGADGTGGIGASGGTGGSRGGLPSVTEMVPELLMAQGLNDVWVASTGERFVVGWDMVAHFDGTRWAPADLPDEIRFKNFRGAFGFAVDDVYAVGEDFVVLHYDGGSWSVADTPEIDLGPLPPQGAGFHDVWGSGPNDVFVVGHSTVLHYDGDAWSALGPSFDDGIEWTGVSGSGPNEVLLAGRVGASEAHAAHFNGAVWVPLTVPPVIVATGYLSVWSAGPNAAYFVGEGGRVSFWNGTMVADQNSGVSETLTDVWGVAPNDMYVITGGGELLYYDGGGWSGLSDAPISGSSEVLSGLFGFAGDDLFVAGTGVHHFDGDEWATVLAGDDDPPALWAAGSNNALMLGEETFRYDGTSVVPEDFNQVNVGTLTAAWGPADNIIAVNDEGAAFRYDGVNWGVMTIDNTEPLNAVWGSASDDVFAVGAAGTIMHFNGTAWSAMTSGVSATFFTDVHGSGSNDVYAVGGSGTIVRYDGLAWVPMNSGTQEILEHVHVFDSSAMYSVHEFGPSFGDGATWQLQPFEIDGQHLRVTSLDGMAPDDLFVSGITTGGINTLSHYDGTTFTPLPTGRAAGSILLVGPRELLATYGSADIYVVRLFVP